MRVRREGKKEEYRDTNRCFVKQLLCLYPFPHFSHRSSPLTLLPSPFERGAPSLARLFLALEVPPRLDGRNPSAIAEPFLPVPISERSSGPMAVSIISASRPSARPSLLTTSVDSAVPPLLQCFDGRLRRFVRIESA